MNKTTAFTYAPARAKGLLFLFPACILLIFLEIFLVSSFGSTNIGLQFFLLLIAMIITGVPLAFLLYRLFSLTFSYYRLERDGLHIQWGLRSEIIPLNAIEWIRSPAEMTEDVPWSVLPMPGAYLGTVSVDDHRTYEFLASDMNRMLFLGTSRYIYVISPQKPAGFMSGFERILQMGSLSNEQWVTARPVGWLLDAWANTTARISVILSLIFLVGLYIWVGLRFQTHGLLPNSFTAEGKPAEGVGGSNALVLPMGATAVWVLGMLLGLWVFQRRKKQGIAELVWGASAAAVLQFLIAAVLNFH